MNARLPFPAVLLLALATLPAQAALMAWRTQVQVSAGSGVGTQFAFDGGLNEASSTVSLSALNSFSADAEAKLTAGGYVPELRSRAIHEGTRSQAVAWGVQGYTNTSGAVLDTSLDIHLTADVTGGNDLGAHVYLFQVEGFDFYQDRGTILFESSSQLWPGFESYANNLGPDGFDISFSNFTGAVNERRSFDFTLQPGESFYVWAQLISTADNSGEVDAFSTLTASLSNTAGLVPANVPEPGVLWLGMLGAGSLLGRRRRH